MKQRDSTRTLVGSAALLGVAITACGEWDREKVPDKVPRQEAKKETLASTDNAKDIGSDIFDALGNVKLPIGAVIPKPPALACSKPRTNRQLVSRVFQDVVNRTPTEEELRGVDSPSFNFETWLGTFLDSPKMEDGYTKFVTNLLRLDAIVPTDPENTSQVQLANDLKQEPVVLVLKNKDKPWPWFWQTRIFYCNERTSSLYGLTRLNTPSFVECKLPDERTGFLGLVSVLRASSPANNPQAFYEDNNNYGRVKNYVYWTKGIKLQAATNGPAGGGPIVPLSDCVPTTDMRVKKNPDGTPGLIFGTASVPLSGSTCSGCHSRYNAPLSIAFRRFDFDGGLMDFTTIDRLNGQETRGYSKDFLKKLLAEQDSCWAPEPDAPPQPFTGLVGLAEITARSPKLGEALGVQVPELLANTSSDANMSAWVTKTYFEEGQTLKAAFKGLFLSDSYRCEGKK